MIDYLAGAEPQASDRGLVEYVGGPRGARRAERRRRPTIIRLAGGTYRRSVRCADDGALRYVWEAWSAEAAT
jgi:hypothetical protein